MKCQDYEMLNVWQDESQFETELMGEEVMPNKEYVKVMAETGLDLDQRKELVQHWLIYKSFHSVPIRTDQNVFSIQWDSR